MEQVEIPKFKKTRKPKEPSDVLEQKPKAKPKTKTVIMEQIGEPTLDEPQKAKTRKPRTKATVNMQEPTLEPKAKAKAKPRTKTAIKEPKAVILQNDKEVFF